MGARCLSSKVGRVEGRKEKGEKRRRLGKKGGDSKEREGRKEGSEGRQS
jgi:hypothetical protein